MLSSHFMLKYVEFTRPKNFNHYLADVVKESVLTFTKSAKIETVTSYIQPGDSIFEEIWNQCDILILTVQNFRLTRSILEKGSKEKKPIIIIDCENLEVTVYSLLNSENWEQLKSKYINSKEQRETELSFSLDTPMLNTPYSPIHCLYWAMALFDTMSKHSFNQLEVFLKDPQYYVETFEKSRDIRSMDSLLIIELVRSLYEKSYPFNFSQMVELAIQILKVEFL